MIIGLTGTMGAGKGIVAEHLKSMGFECHSYSQIIREEANLLGYDETRETLQSIANKIREQSNDRGVLTKILLKKIKSDRVVLDGVRNLAELLALKQRSDSYIIGVKANQRLRFKRLKERTRFGDPITFKEFKEIDDKENKSIGKGQEIELCLKNADFIIVNNGSLGEIRKKVEDVLRQIKKRI